MIHHFGIKTEKAIILNLIFFNKNNLLLGKILPKLCRKTSVVHNIKTNNNLTENELFSTSGDGSGSIDKDENINNDYIFQIIRTVDKVCTNNEKSSHNCTNNVKQPLLMQQSDPTVIKNKTNSTCNFSERYLFYRNILLIKCIQKFNVYSFSLDSSQLGSAKSHSTNLSGNITLYVITFFYIYINRINV